MKHRVLTLGALALIPVGCAESPVPAGSGNQVRISVAPLTLGNVTDACYSLAVYAAELANLTPANFPADDLVWERTPVCATDFGIGTGATGDVSTSGITYIGACDASVATNDVVLILDNLYQDGQSPTSQGGGAGTAIPATEFYNPCTAAEPCILTRPCLPSEDVDVTFDITVMRDSNKGFFDIGVQFEDIFCSAKFDCGYSDGTPIEKIYGTDGELHPTAVLAFTCTAGSDAASHLYLTDIAIECDGGVSQTISPANSGLFFDAPRALPLGAAFPNDVVFQALTSFGQVDNSDFTEYYWSVALGFDLARANNCILTARATATEGTFEDTVLGSGLTPADSTWPVIEFQIPIGTTGTAPNQRLTCADNDGFQNKLNSANSGVFTDYTPVNVRRCFDLAYPGNPALIGTVDDAASTTTCTTDVAPIVDPCLGKPSDYVGTIVFSEGVQVTPDPLVTPIDTSCLSSVSGSLIFSSNAAPWSFGPTSFERLETIGSNLLIVGPQPIALHFPELLSLGGIFQAQNATVVTTFDAPSLVSGRLQIDGASFPNGLSLPSFTTNTIDVLQVTASNIGGPGLQLPVLSSASRILIINSTLSAFAAPALTALPQGMSFNGNTVPALALPSLTSFGSTENVNISSNPTLTSISIPLLTSVYTLNIQTNPNLTSLDFGALSGVTQTFSLNGNASLCADLATDLLTQLTTPAPLSSNVTGNTGSCPSSGPACPLCVSVGDACDSGDTGLSFPLQQCNQFTQCDGSAYAGTFSCPPGLVFSPTLGNCDWPGSEAPGCTP